MAAVEFKVRVERDGDDDVVTFLPIEDGGEIPTEAIDILISSVAAAILKPESVKVDATFVMPDGTKLRASEGALGDLEDDCS